MTSIEAPVLTYLINSAWQLPLITAAAWLASRAVRQNSTTVAHRIWVTALLLEVFLPAVTATPAVVWHRLRLLASTFWPFTSPGGTSGIRIATGPAHPHNAFHLPPQLLPLLLALYATCIVYFALRLGWNARRTAILRRSSTPLTPTGPLAQSWSRYARIFAVHDAELLTSTAIHGPVTLGLRRRALLLPETWQSTVAPDDLSAALAHEFAHMRRRDFAMNLLYEAASIPIAYHPLLWFTRSRLAETREMVCDAITAQTTTGAEKYAHSLLRLAALLAPPSPQPSVHAIGIFDANNLERRIMRLQEKQIELKGTRRWAVALLCALLGAGTWVSATALRLNVFASSTQTEASAPSDSSPRSAAISPGIMAGQLVSRVMPVYPANAKKARIAGAVVMRARIGKTGDVEDLHAISGPKELREPALSAVRQWKYRPYLLNGDPVAVDTTITVTFSLAK